MGFFRQGPMVLAQTRLSIIDLQTGHQPILNEDETLVLVCNGEIYNSPNLREALTEKGIAFAPVPMLRSSFIFTRSTAMTASNICRACLPLRSGTVRVIAYYWRAITWARNPCSSVRHQGHFPLRQK